MPASRARDLAEARLQRACVARLKAAYPQVVTYRHDGGDSFGSPATRNKVACEGGRSAGAPDLFIALRGADGSFGLFIEFKSSTGALLPHQIEVHARLRELESAKVEVVRSVEQFMSVLQRHVGGAEATDRPTTAHRASSSPSRAPPKRRPAR